MQLRDSSGCATVEGCDFLPFHFVCLWLCLCVWWAATFFVFGTCVLWADCILLHLDTDNIQLPIVIIVLHCPAFGYSSCILLRWNFWFQRAANVPAGVTGEHQRQDRGLPGCARWTLGLHGDGKTIATDPKIHIVGSFYPIIYPKNHIVGSVWSNFPLLFFDVILRAWLSDTLMQSDCYRNCNCELCRGHVEMIVRDG